MGNAEERVFPTVLADVLFADVVRETEELEVMVMVQWTEVVS